LLRSSADKNSNPNQSYPEFSNVKNYQHINLALPQQIMANKQINRTTPININPYNKNFEILYGQSTSNQMNRIGNYPQHFGNISNNNVNNPIDRSFALQYNNINYINSLESNQSNQYNHNQYHTKV
jgi:hypothetical protein